jgi:hypothetical protein
MCYIFVLFLYDLFLYLRNQVGPLISDALQGQESECCTLVCYCIHLEESFYQRISCSDGSTS